MTERVEINPSVMQGKPVIRGTRLSVELILELLATGQSETEILANYPELTREDILACLAYASYLAHEYKGYPIPAQMRLLADESFPLPHRQPVTRVMSGAPTVNVSSGSEINSRFAVTTRA
jgi:uncharacterized protein (DUF433 family)